jgi:thiosulfate/3-mercaptopyruvate sulfurtransferase
MAAYTSLISVGELKAHLDDADCRIIDCRFDLLQPAKGQNDFRVGHIPGAVYAHLDDDLAAPVTSSTGRHPLPAVADFVATLRRLGVSRTSQVVAYDGAAGGIAARLWWMLRWLGHDAVAVLDGGYAAWGNAGMPIEATSAAVAAGDFEAAERKSWVLTTAELALGIAQGAAPTLVDAREAARFSGTQEPIDSVAGSIPGAINYPFARNLQEDGSWRSAASLRGAWDELFDGPPPAGWAVMCGSGVTACHLALSAERAGLSSPRLYAGSWSEWIRDPARPRRTADNSGVAGTQAG